LGIEKGSNLHGKCPRRVLGIPSGKGLELCVSGHAERNAIVNAARLGHSVKGCKLYLNRGVPCKECLIEIINSGIVEVICEKIEYYDLMSEYLVKNSKLKVRTYNFEVNK